MDGLRPVVEFVRANGSVLALLFTWAGLVWVYFRRRADWGRKHFLDQVNFSLNTVPDGKLVMRTLQETTARDVWLNDLGVGKVTAAARRTTVDQPFVALADPDDASFLNRAVLNVLSEKFADVYLADGLGLPTKSDVFRFAVTFERYDDMRTLKLRVLVIAERDLEHWFGEVPPGGKEIELRTPLYAARVKTLRAMHKLLKAGESPGAPRLGRVVLGLRA